MHPTALQSHTIWMLLFILIRVSFCSHASLIIYYSAFLRTYVTMRPFAAQPQFVWPPFPSLRIVLVQSHSTEQTPTRTQAHRETLFRVGAGDGAMTIVPRHVNELFTSVPPALAHIISHLRITTGCHQFPSYNLISLVMIEYINQ